MASPVSSSPAVPSIAAAELRDLMARGAVSFYDVRRRSRYEESGEAIPGVPWRDPEQVESWARHLSV
ncbi:MAG: hypothetical protein AAB223_05850, partial [Pseudomonadota bacterium]